VVESGPHELMKRREGELGFRIDTDAPQHAHAICVLGGVLEQGGLANASLPADDKSITSSGASAIEQRLHDSTLDPPAVEHAAIVSRQPRLARLPRRPGGDI
jgi:hypothetical protein